MRPRAIEYFCGGGIEVASCEPTSRAVSQSAEGGYCGKQHKRGMGRSGVKSDLRIWGARAKRQALARRLRWRTPSS